MLNTKQKFNSLFDTEVIPFPDLVSTNTKCKKTPDLFSQGNMGPNILNVSNYIADGFQHVADVAQLPYGPYGNWQLTNVNEELLFSEHDSWVYIIVEDDQVVKLGETGQPLGIQGERTYMLKGTQSRFGRLISHGDATEFARDTDSRIRYHLQESASQGKVSLYALKCKKVDQIISVLGNEHVYSASIHKAVEKAYLNKIQHKLDKLPKLNMARI